MSIWSWPGWIQENIYAGTTLEKITRKKGYDECWREFVNVHKQYIELLVHEEGRMHVVAIKSR